MVLILVNKFIKKISLNFLIIGIIAVFGLIPAAYAGTATQFIANNPPAPFTGIIPYALFTGYNPHGTSSSTQCTGQAIYNFYYYLLAANNLSSGAYLEDSVLYNMIWQALVTQPSKLMPENINAVMIALTKTRLTTTNISAAGGAGNYCPGCTAGLYDRESLINVYKVDTGAPNNYACIPMKCLSNKTCTLPNQLHY